MRYLVDTGVLLRLLHRGDPQHELVRSALRQLVQPGHQLCTTVQNVIEFWNVCTRPAEASRGFGLSPDLTRDRVRILERVIPVLREPATAFSHWKKLVEAYSVRGRQVY